MNTNFALTCQSLQWNVCAAHVNNFSSNLVERVDFSDSRVALLWAGLQVFANK